MRIIITGNMGYVGPVLARFLRTKIGGCTLVGYDSGFFGHCLTNSAVLPETLFDRQYFGDIRDLDAEVLKGADAVVHLAAVSNDPMGSKYEAVTEQVNQQASVPRRRAGQQGRRTQLRVRVKLQHVWQRRRRPPQGDRRNKSAHGLCALQDRHRTRSSGWT